MEYNINKKNILYLGNNNFKKHKRGVENVILFQSKTNIKGFSYYIFWDNITSVTHYDNILCIGIKKNIFWPIILNFFILKIIFKKRKVLIHSHNPLMSLLSLIKTDLFSVHDPLYYLAYSNSYKYLSFYRFIEKLVYKRSKYIHFISEFSKSMSLIPNNISYSIIYNTSFLESKIDNINTEYNVPDNKTNILIVRSIEERARIDLIIDVAKKYNTNNVQFTIVGTGPFLNYYSDYINNHSLKNIKMIGYVNDFELIKYYQSCDIVIVTAEYGEGFGLPIIEGYLFNKPVIASNKCAIPEIIYSNNYLFENDKESIINKINELTKVDNVNFKEYYTSNFSNKIIFYKFERLYNSIYQC